MLALTGLNVGLADTPLDRSNEVATFADTSGPRDLPSNERATRGHESAAAETRVGQHRVFLGNLHSHTSYSDGSGTPKQAYTYARTRGKLDFLAITEHNHARAEDGAKDRRDGILIATNPSLYEGAQANSLISSARAAQEDGHFVALFGQEFSTISSGNHMNVFDVTSVIRVDNGDFSTLLREWLPAHLDTSGGKPLVQLNHPNGEPDEYGQDDFSTREEWVAALDPYAELIEVFNGPGTKDGSDLTPERFTGAYLKLLDLGFHLGPTGNQDNHYFTWGTLSSTRTGVIAASLTKTDLLAALKARHVFASLDANLRVVAEVIVDGKRSLMGDLIPPPRPGTEFQIAYQIRDEDEPDADYRIDVLGDLPGDDEPATTIESIRVSGAEASSGVIDGLPFTEAGQYVLLRITQSSEDDGNDPLWTAPVWFEQSGAVPPSTAETKAVASKNSGVYHPDPTCRFARAISASNRVQGAEAQRGRQRHDGCPK